MKRSKSVELFLALGLAATVGACGSPTATTSTDQHESGAADTATTHASPDQGGEGGEGGEGSEGGEGGEGGAASTGNADVNYMTTLGLMKGHLMVAQELLEQGKYDEAEPHIGHPVEELYGGIEADLTSRNVPEFKSTLTELHDLAQSSPDSPETKAAFDKSMQALDAAIAALPESQRQSPDFVMDVINQMLKTAGEEYEAAIADGKFAETVEYQDSRGFVMYADELYQGIAGTMSQQKAEQHKTITDSFTKLKAAWPSVNPPAAPVQTPSEVLGLISQIELNS